MQQLEPTMQGDEATLLILVANAITPPMVIQTFHQLDKYHVPHSPLTLRVTSKASSRTGSIDTALQVIQHALYHPHFEVDPMLYQNAFQAAVVAKDWPKGLTLLKKLRDIQQTVPSATVQAFLVCCVDAREWTALETALQYQESSQDMLQFMLEYLCTVEHCPADPALSIYYSLSPCPAPLYPKLLRLLICDGCWHFALTILHEMQSTTKFVSMQKASRSFADTALEVLKQYKALGLELDVSIYNAVLLACGRVGDNVNARRLLDEMKAGGWRPDATSYRACLASCHRDYQQALALMEEYPGIPTLDMYVQCLMCCAKDKQYEKVIEVFQEMQTHYEEVDAKCYSLALIAYAKLKYVEAAFEIFWSMRKGGIKPTSYACAEMIRLYGENGDPEKGLKLFDLLHERTEPLYRAAIYCARLAQNDVQTLYVEMKRAGIKPNAWTLVDMVLACPMEQSLYFWKESRSCNQRFRVLNAILIKCLGPEGSLDDLQAIVVHAKEERVDFQSGETRKLLLQGLVKFEQYEEALLVHQHMLQDQQPLDTATLQAIDIALDQTSKSEDSTL